MSNKNKKDVIRTKIWNEEPEPDNPFAARKCICAGYDVYGDLLGKISWIEYLYLLFRLDPPTKQQALTLETLAVALANPGPRDLSVRAAMNAGVGGSTAASYLMAAVAPGAGQYGGARELYLFRQLLDTCGTDIDQWETHLSEYSKPESVEVWPDIDHIPGFDPYGASCPLPVQQTMKALLATDDLPTLQWLADNQKQLESFADGPITMVTVSTCVLTDLGFDIDQSELLFLLLRLPGAAAHALEQKGNGWRKFPFFSDGLKLLARKNEFGS